VARRTRCAGQPNASAPAQEPGPRRLAGSPVRVEQAQRRVTLRSSWWLGGPRKRTSTEGSSGGTTRRRQDQKGFEGSDYFKRVQRRSWKHRATVGRQRWNGLWIVQPAVSFAPDHPEHRMLCAWEFFALCPRCRETGEPRAAASYRSAAGQQTMVRYWCGGCEHSWEVTSNDDDRSADAPEGESLFWYRVTDC
jgi:hypothetical protein